VSRPSSLRRRLRRRGNYSRAYLDNGITRFPAQIWLDASGHVRELHWTVHPVTTPTETSTEIFSYSTAVVTINFPPPIDVTPAADRITAYSLAPGQCCRDRPLIDRMQNEISEVRRGYASRL
jgi:hypothetical protein